MTQAPAVPARCTREVQSFYEAYPYPSERSPMLRSGFCLRRVLSMGSLSREPGRTLQVLDAGCGRGVGLVTCASLHPDATVLGVDICERSLQDAREEIARRGLSNARVQALDLSTLAGLEVPAGGFDVIYSSGVVHHLEDPMGALAKLREVLAPGGVLVIMVYGTIGRLEIKRVARTLKAWLAPGLTIEEKLEAARFLVQGLAKGDADECPWQAAASLADAEFVDRYLHPQETDYDIPGFFDLIEGAGLAWLQWCNPEAWSLAGHLESGPLRDSIEALPLRERLSAIEQIRAPKNLQAFAVHPENSARTLPPPKQWRETLFAANPEVHFAVGRRNLWRSSRIENVAFAKRAAEPVDLEAGCTTEAGLILSTQNEPFRGAALIEALKVAGYDEAQALEGLRELLRLELIYSPPEVELT